MKRFGEKLRRLRQEQSLTVRQLASLMNMKSHSHITDMENGRSLPSVELLVKLADFFQVTTDQLLRDELEIDWQLWQYWPSKLQNRGFDKLAAAKVYHR